MNFSFWQFSRNSCHGILPDNDSFNGFVDSCMSLEALADVDADETFIRSDCLGRKRALDGFHESKYAAVCRTVRCKSILVRRNPSDSGDDP